LRKLDLDQCRKTFGIALGTCTKEKLFKDYIAIELSLREFDRARQIYEKYLQWNPSNCTAWINFAELEKMLGDLERSRGIYEIATNQTELDLPEVLWKSYLDFEVENEEWEKARGLYTRLLDRTNHVKVQISFANFEFTAQDGTLEERTQKARERFEISYDWCKNHTLKEERVLLLEAWVQFEHANGTEEELEKVKAKQPKSVKKRRKVVVDGVESGWEEYFDYIFPEDDTDAANIKLLAMAHQWKMNKVDSDSESEEESD
jgi:crooked neck